MTEPGTPRATALLALWNDVAPGMEAEYEDWHAREHVPERLTVPGMLWGRRYADTRPSGGPRYLTLYGLRDVAVLDGEPYQRLLREPTPTSARMRPALRHVIRWVCSLHEDAGAALAPGTVFLAAWTLPDAPAALQAHAWLTAQAPELPCWLARRCDDAAPLPWLAAGQAGALADPRGGWLLCAPVDTILADSAAQRGARIYRPLPVG